MQFPRLRLDCGDPSVSVGRKRVHNVGCQSVQSLYQPAMRNGLSKSRRGTAAQIARRLYGSTEALSAFKDNWLLETRADSSSLSVWHGRLFSRQPRDPKALLSAGAELYVLTDIDIIHFDWYHDAEYSTGRPGYLNERARRSQYTRRIFRDVIHYALYPGYRTSAWLLD